MPIDKNEYAAAGIEPAADPGTVYDAEARNLPDLEVRVDADPLIEIARRIADEVGALARAKALPPEPRVLARHRFRIVCMEVLGHTHDQNEASRVAEVLVGGVYSGHVGYKQLRTRIFANETLSEEAKWLCLGLCAGFMVDFLPRVRG